MFMKPSFIKYKLYPNMFGWFFIMSKIVKWLKSTQLYLYNQIQIDMIKRI